MRAILIAVVIGLAALYATASDAQTVVLVKSRAQLARLRTILVDQAITCPRVVMAWEIKDNSGTALRFWKVACSNNSDWGIMRQEDGSYYVNTWAHWAEIFSHIH